MLSNTRGCGRSGCPTVIDHGGEGCGAFWVFAVVVVVAAVALMVVVPVGMLVVVAAVIALGTANVLVCGVERSRVLLF